MERYQIRWIDSAWHKKNTKKKKACFRINLILRNEYFAILSKLEFSESWFLPIKYNSLLKAGMHIHNFSKCLLRSKFKYLLFALKRITCWHIYNRLFLSFAMMSFLLSLLAFYVNMQNQIMFQLWQSNCKFFELSKIM